MLKTKYKNKNQGFTLVEVLVVIAIMVMFTMISIPSYGSYVKTLNIKSDAKDIRSLLWEAQALSLGPKNDDAVSYQVDFETTDDREFRLQEKRGVLGDIGSFATLDRLVSIESIELGDGTDLSGQVVSVIFDTGLESGKSQDAGSIKFFNGDIDLGGTRFVIKLMSVASDVTYSVVINRELGSIIIQ